MRISLDTPPDGIRPDLSATADVITATREEVLAIPIIALTLIDEDDFELMENELMAEDSTRIAGRDASQIEGVYVVEDGVVHFRPVVIGITGDSHFEVIDGLREGEMIVSGSYQAIRELRDSTSVKIEESDEQTSRSRN